jgi:hypothetical protein
MALQSSGAISLSQIKTELGSSANDFRTLHAAAGFSTPDSISEFYGFSASTEFTFYAGDGQNGFGDYASACAEAYDPITLYAAVATLGNNLTLYTDNTLSTAFNGGGLWYKSGNTVYEIPDGGKITAQRGC